MWIKKARAALSHPAFTGISRNHLDRLVAELADPFAAAREGRLHQRRGGRQRHRWPGAGHPETLTLRDRLLCTLVWLRLALPHQAIAVLYGVERSMVSKAIAQMRPLLDAPVLIAVGAAFDFHTGAVRQAPLWMQRSGLEWLFRLAAEPRRLWRRYLVDNPWFLWELALQKTGLRRFEL